MDNRHNKKLIMYFMFSVFYFLMLESAEAVNCSTTLEANTVYILTEDLYINGSTCFNINVENVTIDCDGFSITGNNAGSTYGVYSNQFNTTIRSCQISNFTTGIYFNGAENGMIQNTNVTITKFWDMYTHEGTGIALVNTNNTLITNCNGNAIESTVGIYLRSSSYNTISNSTGASNGYQGIRTDFSSYNTISDSSGTSLSNIGILLSYSNYSNITRSSGSTYYFGAGIVLSHAFHNNIISSNGTAILKIPQDKPYPTGIVFSSSSNNTISNSIATSYDNYAIQLYSDSNNNIISNNTLVSILGTRTLLNISSNSHSNTFYWNNFTSTSGYYVQDLDGSNYYNTSVGSVPQGNYYFNISSKNIYDSDDDGWGDSGDDYPLSASTWASKWSGYGTDYGPATDKELVNCSTVLEANTVYTLTENVSINGSTCFNVSVENVTIDCDGFSIRGNNSVNTYGIYSTTYNTTIVNCDINTFQYAVYFNGATNGNIKDSNVSSQHGSGGTIYLRYGSNNNIENVRSIVQVSGPRGIQIINSIGNTISSVTATGTASGSISLYSANYTNIINTNSSSTGYGNAFLIASNSHYNNLINVTWASPLWSGVIFELSDDNSLINSSGTAGLHSIYIYTSSNTTIDSSTGTSNTGNGIYAWYNSHNNRIINSTGTSTSGYGIYVYTSNNNIIVNSSGASSSSNGLRLIASSGNNITSSTLRSGTSTPVFMNGSSNNNIISNTLISNNNLTDLIKLYLSSGNKLFWNNFTQTTGYYVQDSNGSNFYNTSVGGVAQGNYYFNITSKNIYDSNNDGWGDSGDDYPLSSLTWASKWTGYGTDYGPATDKELVNCSTVLEANTVYTLTENVSINGSTCFNVSVENVTIDCDGFSIRGNNSVNTYGIYSTTYNTTIVNCDINTFQYAVYFNGATNGNIKDSNVSSQHGSGGTIYLRYGSNNNIENVRSIVQVSGPRGIQIINSIGNTISSVTATGTASGSISLYSANYTNIINTNSSSTGYGNAFLIASNSHYNNLINVTWASPLWSGVIFELSDDNSLINSSGTAGLHSIYIYTSSNTTIDSSTGTSNTGNGIYAWYNSHNNRIINSTGTSTSGYGIYVYTSNNNIIVNSSGASSSSNGLRLIASSGNNITSSTLRSGTSTPVFMNGSSNNNIISNTLISNNNLTDLIKLYLSSGNKLFWNNFTQTTGYYVQDSNGSNFYNTSVGGVAQGNYYFNITSKNIYDSNNDGWGDSGDDYPLSSLTWASKWTGYGTDYGPATTREESSGSSGGSNSDYVPSNVIAPSDEIEPEEEETPEPIIESITIEEVEANTPKNFVLQNEEIPVSNIVITTESALKNVELSVTSYDYNPTTPITQSKSKVYKYLQIQKSIEDTQLKNASIIFIVKKNWLKEQGVSENDIILLRLKDKNWSELDTSILNITNDSILYEAITPGFSFFAIAIRFETADSGPSSMVVSNSSELPKTVIVVNPEKIVKKTTVFATPLIIIIAVIVMLASAGALSIGSFKFKKKEINIKPIKGNLSEAQRHQVWDYINKARALNVSDEKLIENLRKGGLSDEHISTFSLDPKLYPKK